MRVLRGHLAFYVFLQEADFHSGVEVLIVSMFLSSLLY